MKTIIRLFSILILATLLIGSGCDYWTVIDMRNNSNNIIACYFGAYHSSFPDTLLQNTPVLEHLTEHISGKSMVASTRWRDFSIFFKVVKNGLLSVYVFDQEELDSLGWEGISSQNKYLVRYDLTESDLNRLKGNLSFPPSVDMKNVKMWPRYEEVIRPYERPSRHSPVTGDTHR